MSFLNDSSYRVWIHTRLLFLRLTFCYLLLDSGDLSLFIKARFYYSVSVCLVFPFWNAWQKQSKRQGHSHRRSHVQFRCFFTLSNKSNKGTFLIIAGDHRHLIKHVRSKYYTLKKKLLLYTKKKSYIHTITMQWWPSCLHFFIGFKVVLNSAKQSPCYSDNYFYNVISYIHKICF